MNKLLGRCEFWTVLSLVINVVAVAAILAMLFNPQLIYLMFELKSRFVPVPFPTPYPTVIP